MFGGSRGRKLVSLALETTAASPEGVDCNDSSSDESIIEASLLESPCPSVDEEGFKAFSKALAAPGNNNGCSTTRRTAGLQSSPQPAASRSSKQGPAPRKPPQACEPGTQRRVLDKDLSCPNPRGTSVRRRLALDNSGSRNKVPAHGLNDAEELVPTNSTLASASASLQSIANDYISSDDDCPPRGDVENVLVLPVHGEVMLPSPMIAQEDDGSTSQIVHIAPASNVNLAGTNLFLEDQNEESAELLLDENPNENEKLRTRANRPQASPTRKRTRNEPLWKRTVAKRLKNSGQSYVDSRGKEHPAAQMRHPCSCKWDCRHRLTPTDRKKIFDVFWALGDHSRQWDFIRANSLSKVTVPQGDMHDLKRKVNRSFHFEINKEKVKVCKQMFMSTLGIWDSWVASAYSHVNPDKGNTVSPDKRGGNRKGIVTAITQEKIMNVKEHVNLFPRIPSHYCRKRTKREYLQNGLSISKMARLYKIWAQEKKLPKTSIATKRQYRDIVNTNFNIGFYMPKKDQCSFCCIMKNKNNTREIREERKLAWAAHVKNKQVSRAVKAKDKKDGEKDKKIAVVSFDLQKQLTCPKSESSAMFYRRKLTVYNFTVFNMVERAGICFLWHEAIGKKGSSEICSALLNYVDELVQKGYQTIIFWSDNCGGQNKNRNLFAMYEYLAVKYSIEIKHRYLEPGHTQMEVDSIHANIERAANKIDIFDFEDWIDVIEKAKEELPKYQVRQLTTNKIFSFKSLVEKQNWEVDLEGVKISWSKVKEIYVNGKEGNLVRIKYDHAQEDFITISPNRRGHPVNLCSFKPSQAYNGKLPIPGEKLEDLLWLCENYHVPLNKQAFLRSVIGNVFAVDGEEVSDIDYATDENSEGEEFIPGEESDSGGDDE